MIPFSKPAITGKEQEYINDAITSSHLSGDGPYTDRCHQWFEEHLQCKKALLTPSCTAALEMAAILIDIQPGDEVIMPSYTFVSTANAFVLRGAKIVFVDVRPDTMNIDERLIQDAITSKTKAIVPVHYAGVACEMDTIMDIAEQNGLYVIEDAAQGMMATYKGRALGTIGHIGTYSFHATKNYTSGGEGGLLIINRSEFIQRSTIIREKGTNRSLFINGAVDKYTWVDIGSSFLPSEIQAAFLYAQLEHSTEINNQRLDVWNKYFQSLHHLQEEGYIQLPDIPTECQHNAHIFYIKMENKNERDELISFLKNNNIQSTFHYIPLHNSKFGLQYCAYQGVDKYTTKESNRLLRLPIFVGVDAEYIISKIKSYFHNHDKK